MTVALVLSGGSGTRMGLIIPKQYIKVDGKAVISYCLETLLAQEIISAVQIVAAREWRKKIVEDIVLNENMGKVRGFSEPGKTRQLSILNGLKDIKKYAVDTDHVLICDAARPLMSSALIIGCAKAAKNNDGAVPVLPMKDTVYLCEDEGKISARLDRDKIFAGQAPEIFILGKYYEANMRLFPDEILKIAGSTEPAVMAGMDIAMITGDEDNFKITTKTDLDRFREIVKNRKNGKGIRNAD